ncbi:MAG: O-antigen polysaccharide polymerase Wzy, partial [Pseudomonadota bacterium]|nr:O-antigen polysaccharide polymerase Wzy [Pseudomonadota bacterium]
FHLSHVFLFALGESQLRFLVEDSIGQWYELATWYVVCSLGCLGLGVALSRPPRADGGESHATIEETEAVGFWAGLGLLAGSAVAFVMLVAAVGNILAYSRTEIFAGVGDTRGLGFFLLVLPSAVILLVCTARKGPQQLLAFLLAAAYFVAVMFLGERSAALFPMLVGLVVWRKLGRSIPTPVIAGILIGVLVIVPAVRQLRDVGPYSRITSQDVAASFKGTQAGDVFLELGAMHGVLAYVLKWVPAEEPYRYGMSYLKALPGAIPNIGFRQGQSERSLMSGGAMDTAARAREMSPADWYIFRLNRWMFDVGGGGGFSFIAEAYLNFGLAGVVVVMFGVGLFLGRLDYRNLRHEPRWVVLAVITMWPLLKIIRNDFDNFVKPIGLIMATLLIWWMISKVLGFTPAQHLRSAGR